MYLADLGLHMVTSTSSKRIRSSYQKRILEWLIDAGGSVSDVAQALDLRVPHASLALSQLRESGDVARDDDTGIRGAIHRITERGRKRLELDAVACLEKYVSEIPENMDAIVLDSNGPMLLLGYANKTPPSMIQLPLDPADFDANGNLISIGNTGVRWATIRNIQPKWYDINTLEKVPVQDLQATGTLDDWTSSKNYLILVRAYLFDFDRQWNIAPGTWFSSPKINTQLPAKLSEGNHLLGTVLDSNYQIYPNQMIYANLNSDIDTSLSINALSKDAIVLRDFPVKQKNRLLPLGCIDFWIRKQHPRMNKLKLANLLLSVKSFLLGDSESNIPISTQRAIIRDFGECSWIDEIHPQIDVKYLSETGAISLIEYFLVVNEFDLIIEWSWPTNTNQEIFDKLRNSKICRLLISRNNDFSRYMNSQLIMKSLNEIGQVELLISREQSIKLELSKLSENKISIDVEDVIPKNASELFASSSGESWDLSLMTGRVTDYQTRISVWTALNFYPEGDETWANKIESQNPLAAWIASPPQFRYSRWIRVAELLPDGWADLLDLTELSSEDILFAIPRSGTNWQDKAIIEIKNRYLSNNELILQDKNVLSIEKVNSWFAITVLLCSNELGKEFDSILESCLEIWLDSPRRAEKILANLFPRNSVGSRNEKNMLDLCLVASKVHPKDSILYCWAEFIECIRKNTPVSLEQSRKFMSILPMEWWYNQGYEWLKLQLNSTSGRNWLSEKYLPWPSILCRANGEKCGPPGHKELFSSKNLSSDDLLHIMILGDGIGKTPLLDTYDMIFSFENKQKLPVGRIHPLTCLLIRETKTWPEIDLEVLKQGDIHVSSLLLMRYYKECLIEN